MSHLSQMIPRFIAEEIEAFRGYCQKTGKTGNILKLFNLFCDHAPLPSELKHLRSTFPLLENEINHFIILQRIGGDTSAVSETVIECALAVFWCERDAADVASKHFLASVKAGSEGHEYGFLEGVYQHLYPYARAMGFEAETILEDWKENSGKLNNAREVMELLSRIDKDVTTAMSKGDSTDPQGILNAAMKQFNASLDIQKNPLIMHSLTGSIRKGLLSAKRFVELYFFVLSVYRDLQEHNAFTRTTLKYELGIVSMLAHAALRSFRFKKAQEELVKMQHLLPDAAFRMTHHFGKYIAMKGAIQTYTGEVRESIKWLNIALDKHKARITRKEMMNIMLNQSVNLFYINEFNKAIEMLRSMDMVKKERSEVMGMEFCLKADMVEMLALYKIGSDQALKLNDWIKRHYKEMLDKKIYERTLPFLKAIRMIIVDPAVVKTKKFLDKVKDIEKARNGNLEDLHALMFFSFILAEMENRPLYAVMRGRVDWVRENISGDLV